MGWFIFSVVRHGMHQVRNYARFRKLVATPNPAITNVNAI